MTKAEARREAMGRASGALQAYVDGGSLWEFYENLPDDDQEKIAEEFRHIIEQLEKQWRKEL